MPEIAKNHSSPAADAPPIIGVLDLQGGVQEHLAHLVAVGVQPRRVKEAGDLAGLAGLILPGGESTCLARLLRIFGIMDAIEAEYHRGLRLWGTCAGAILLAKHNIGETAHLPLIDIDIKRNAFGSQLDSFNCVVTVPKVADEPVPLTFIRAPKILRAGPDVEVLLRIDDFIAAASTERILVTVFHPELTPCLAFHRHFARLCGLRNDAAGDGPAPVPVDPNWDRKSWMRFANLPRVCA